MINISELAELAVTVYSDSLSLRDMSGLMRLGINGNKIAFEPLSHGRDLVLKFFSRECPDIFIIDEPNEQTSSDISTRIFDNTFGKAALRFGNLKRARESAKSEYAESWPRIVIVRLTRQTWGHRSKSPISLYLDQGRTFPEECQVDITIPRMRLFDDQGMEKVYYRIRSCRPDLRLPRALEEYVNVR